MALLIKKEKKRLKRTMGESPALLLIESNGEKMDKIIVATFKVRGTEKEIERIKARIASLTACEEIVSMHIREVKT